MPSGDWTAHLHGTCKLHTVCHCRTARRSINASQMRWPRLVEAAPASPSPAHAVVYGLAFQQRHTARSLQDLLQLEPLRANQLPPCCRIPAFAAHRQWHFFFRTDNIQRMLTCMHLELLPADLSALDIFCVDLVHVVRAIERGAYICTNT